MPPARFQLPRTFPADAHGHCSCCAAKPCSKVHLDSCRYCVVVQILKDDSCFVEAALLRCQADCCTYVLSADRSTACLHQQLQTPHTALSKLLFLHLHLPWVSPLRVEWSSSGVGGVHLHDIIDAQTLVERHRRASRARSMPDQHMLPPFEGSIGI